MKMTLSISIFLMLGYFDAVHCGLTICLSTQFKCISGKCIPLKLRCNGNDDCGDNSDEQSCEPLKCSSNQFKCVTSGICIRASEVCDGIEDCFDKSDEQFCSCGQNPEGAQTPHIVGGRDTTNWPWMAAIIKLSDSSLVCGGSLISDIYVLSAAHCFAVEYTKNDLKVRLAENDFLSTNDNHHVDYRIVEVRMHDEYNITGSLENDIAVIRLNKAASFSKFIYPICILPPNIELTDKFGFILGWGRINFDGPVSTKLQIARIPVWNQKSCVDKYQRFNVSSTMMCAGDKHERRTSCQGDSGGPLMVQLENGATWYAAGIVSWNTRCALDRNPTVFTRVNHYLNWISENTKFLGCTSSEFECKSSPKQCIPPKKLCDGKIDCFDNSDEENCNLCLGFNKENAQCSTGIGYETGRCTCTHGFFPIRKDACNGCANPCVDFISMNASCDAIDYQKRNCRCSQGFHPVHGDACNGCDDPCQWYNYENATCSAIDAVSLDCKCKNNFYPIEDDACNDCADPCSNFKPRNNVCLAVSFDKFKCRCNTGYFEIFKSDPCFGCQDPCIGFRVRNANCVPVDDKIYNCICEAGFVPTFDKDPCFGCQEACPSHLGYKEYPTFGCLKKHSERKVSWEAARTSCVKEGGDLFSPGNSKPLLPQAELNLKPDPNDGPDYWIGIRKNGQRSPYKRLSDSTTIPDNSPLWDDRNPERGDQDFVYYWTGSELIHDAPSRWVAYFICQITIS